MTFLQQTAPAQANTWYDTSDGGRRIVYEPAQTHPWNHFSATTTGYAISFYQTAFADYASLLRVVFPMVHLLTFLPCRRPSGTLRAQRPRAVCRSPRND